MTSGDLGRQEVGPLRLIHHGCGRGRLAVTASFAESRTQTLIPLKTLHVEDLMHVKSVDKERIKKEGTIFSSMSFSSENRSERESAKTTDLPSHHQFPVALPQFSAHVNDLNSREHSVNMCYRSCGQKRTRCDVTVVEGG
ncbi:hypothetical protein TNCV_5120241 [Trichonephila clavipes]|nr:hypothetical protein TNCV_5120241 [Trichonephila clavipes]